jgi:hypothetical protein
MADTVPFPFATPQSRDVDTAVEPDPGKWETEVAIRLAD